MPEPETQPLARRIEGFGSDPASRGSEAWTRHEDINGVMLAKSLVPVGYF